jgi:hypothetical protein
MEKTRTPASATREMFSRSLYTCVRLTRQESRPSHGGGVTGVEVAAVGATVVVVDGAVLLVTGATFVEVDVVVAPVDPFSGAGVRVGVGAVVNSFKVGDVGDGVGSDGAVVTVALTVEVGHFLPLAPNRTANQTDTETTVIMIRTLTTVDIFEFLLLISIVNCDVFTFVIIEFGFPDILNRFDEEHQISLFNIAPCLLSKVKKKQGALID